jgi:serine/threonine-protein kinase
MLDSLIAGMVVAGRYRLEQRFATGACGSLWHGHDELTHLPCTVRLADTGVADLRAARERFEREVQAAEALRCENVVNVIDHGEWSGMPFVVFEALQGEDLATRLRRERRLETGHVIELVSDVAHALSRAHDLGIVHRDLKPENIFLVRVGVHEVAKVLDFGIAGGGASALNRTTKVGHHLGLPLYTSPEQASGGNVDFRSDLWALGAIAYHCLVGRAPFDSTALDALLTQISSGEAPKPHTLDPELPVTLDAWCENALSRDPELRFQSAAELADAFAHAFQRATLTGHPSPEWRTREARRSISSRTDESDDMAWLSGIPDISARNMDGSSDAPLSRQRAAWNSSGLRRHALRVSAGAMLVLLLGTLGVTLLRAPSPSTDLAQASIPRAAPIANRSPAPAAEPVAPAAEPAAAPATEATDAPHALVPAPTEVAPCQALPVGAAPLSGPPATPAPAIHPQRSKANSEEIAPRRERKTEARRDAEALRGVSSEPDYGI